MGARPAPRTCRRGSQCMAWKSVSVWPLSRVNAGGDASAWQRPVRRHRGRLPRLRRARRHRGKSRRVIGRCMPSRRSSERPPMSLPDYPPPMRALSYCSESAGSKSLGRTAQRAALLSGGGKETIDDHENDEGRNADAEAPADKLFLYWQERLCLDLAQFGAISGSDIGVILGWVPWISRRAAV